jgi:tetratricopeptide (TPR) repeat protein
MVGANPVLAVTVVISTLAMLQILFDGVIPVHYSMALSQNTISTAANDDGPVLNDAGVALITSGNYTGAIDYYDTVLAVEPNNTDALYHKGEALYRLDEYNGALKYYKASNPIPNPYPMHPFDYGPQILRSKIVR